MRNLPEPVQETLRWLLTAGLAFFLADVALAGLERRFASPPKPLATNLSVATPVPATPVPAVTRLLSTSQQREGSTARPTDTEAPERATTEATLSVTLVGTMAGVGGAGVAMLSVGAEHVVVSAGQPLEDWTVSAVFPTSAVLNRGAQTVTLEMNAPAQLQTSSRPSVALPKVSSPADSDTRSAADAASGASAEPFRTIREVREAMDHPEIYTNQGAFKSVVRDDAVVGYRLKVKDPRFPIARLGLKDADLVTSVNGVPLDGPGALPRVMDIVRNTLDYRIEIERDGQLETVEVHLEE